MKGQSCRWDFVIFAFLHNWINRFVQYSYRRLTVVVGRTLKIGAMLGGGR